MLEILNAIKRIIERFIINMTPLREAVSSGDTFIPLPRTRRFRCGDVVVIYNRPSQLNQPEGEVHVATQICEDGIVIDTPLVASYPVNDSYVEKMIGYEHGNEAWLDGIYIGEPEVILKYPAITINGVSRSSQWFTIETTRETYDIDITVYVLAADYQAQMELMYTYVKQIEDSLFRSFYPLVEPYVAVNIIEPVKPGDTIVRTDNSDLISSKGACWVFLEGNDYLKSNSIVADLGGGVYQLQIPVAFDFAVGDKLIQPWRHMFNSLPKGTQYGTVNKNTMLKAGKISYLIEEEVWRRAPYIDPLTF